MPRRERAPRGRDTAGQASPPRAPQPWPGGAACPGERGMLHLRRPSLQGTTTRTGPSARATPMPVHKGELNPQNSRSTVQGPARLGWKAWSPVLHPAIDNTPRHCISALLWRAALAVGPAGYSGASSLRGWTQPAEAPAPGGSGVQSHSPRVLAASVNRQILEDFSPFYKGLYTSLDTELQTVRAWQL